MVARLLTREGHTVAEASDGVAAVSMVSRTLMARGSDYAAKCAEPFFAIPSLGLYPSLSGPSLCHQASAPSPSP